MKHLNGNLLCVMDVETTGTKAGIHDITNFAVLPVNTALEPDEDIMAFDLLMRPNHNIDQAEWEALKTQYKSIAESDNPADQYSQKINLNREDIVNAMLQGMDQDTGAQLFVDWFESLKLAPKKRIQPIGHNIHFDLQFIEEWLGRKTFEYIFDPRYRDTMAITMYLNDCADWRGEMFPYAKNTLRYLASQLKCELMVKHRALDDCLVTLEVYKKLVRR